MNGIGRTDYTVVRNNDYKRAAIPLRERHNERRNEEYANPDIVKERRGLNLHFKQPEGSYIQAIDRLVADGTISLRGLKPDADVLCEFVFDVSTAYFEEHGGYDFAKSFFEEAYRMAVREVGDERYILSAVMHADERNKSLSETLGHDVYHYHMHVVYVPVVEKEIRWSKRCKDEHLRGTVKEVVRQVSRSKKWAYPQALDGNGQPILSKNGNPVRIPSYSLLQDRFYEHMKNAGFVDLERGNRGSDARHLSVLDYKLQKDSEKLEKLEALVDSRQQMLDRLSGNLAVAQNTQKTFQELEDAGRKTLRGRIELSEKDYLDMVALSKEGILSRPKIHDLTRKLGEAKTMIDGWRKKYDMLFEQTRDFVRAMKIAPQRVKEFLSDLLTHEQERHQAKAAITHTRKTEKGREKVDRESAR